MADPTTTLIHHPYQPPEGFAAPQPGVFKASTVFFPNVAAMRSREWKDKTGYTYGLHGTPTTYLLEERLCTLEGGSQCLLAPSGLAAISLVLLSLLQAGDEVLIPDNAYAPTKALAEGELAGWGIRHQIYDPLNAADLQAKINPKTRLVWLEAAGSVTLEFPDLLGLLRVCKAAGVLTVLDNTWGAGLAFQPFNVLPASQSGWGVDVSVHALTKYPSGGGDVLMGSVITRDEALHQHLKRTHMRLGLGVGANDVEAVLRSLPSLALRYARHDAVARELAQWCQLQPQCVQVLHPALPDSPGHDYWKAVCQTTLGGAAGLFSVLLHPGYTQEQTDTFCNALRYFRLGYSWGGPVSLVVPYDLHLNRTGWPSHIAEGTLLRFCVGLEALEDLRADLAQALATLPPPVA